MSQAHTRLLFVMVLFSLLSFVTFGIAFHNKTFRLLGVSFIFMITAVSIGLLINWKYVGTADITIRAGGGSAEPLHDKMHQPRSSINAGKIIHQESHTKGERGYLGAIFLFGSVLLLFLIVAIALIIWGGG